MIFGKGFWVLLHEIGRRMTPSANVWASGLPRCRGYRLPGTLAQAFVSTGDMDAAMRILAGRDSQDARRDGDPQRRILLCIRRRDFVQAESWPSRPGSPGSRTPAPSV